MVCTKWVPSPPSTHKGNDTGACLFGYDAADGDCDVPCHGTKDITCVCVSRQRAQAAQKKTRMWIWVIAGVLLGAGSLGWLVFVSGLCNPCLRAAECPPCEAGGEPGGDCLVGMCRRQGYTTMSNGGCCDRHRFVVMVVACRWPLGLLVVGGGFAAADPCGSHSMGEC